MRSSTGASGNGGNGKWKRKAETENGKLKRKAETEKLKLGNGRQYWLR